MRKLNYIYSTCKYLNSQDFIFIKPFFLSFFPIVIEILKHLFTWQVYWFAFLIYNSQYLCVILGQSQRNFLVISNAEISSVRPSEHMMMVDQTNTPKACTYIKLVMSLVSIHFLKSWCRRVTGC